jgi:hypothetical protein
LLGSGWWLGKSPSTLRVQVDHLAAQRAQDGRRRGARDAVAAVDHDLHRARQLAVAHDAVAYSGTMSIVALRPWPLHVGLALDALAQLLDVVAVDGAAGHHHLEAVVVLRVVAAGDLDAAGAAMRAARGGHVVQHGRGHRAEVDHVQPGGHFSPRISAGHQARARQPAVAAHGHRLLPAARASEPKARPRCSAKVSSMSADDAADVIGLENGCR